MVADGSGLWTEYNAAQHGRPVRDLLLRTVELAGPGERRQAVDFGCGAGIETRELLRHGWRVCAVDGDAATAERLKAEAPATAAPLEVILADFVELQELPATDLFYAGLSLPFVPAEHFDRIWDVIRASLRPAAWLAVHLFGDRDSWSASGDATCLPEARVRDLFTGIDLYAFEEEERDGASFVGDKHWHVFTIIGRRAPVASLDA